MCVCMHICHFWDLRIGRSYGCASFTSLKSFVCGVAQTAWQVERMHDMKENNVITFWHFLQRSLTPHVTTTMFNGLPVSSTLGGGGNSVCLFRLRCQEGNVVWPHFYWYSVTYMWTTLPDELQWCTCTGATKQVERMPQCWKC